MSVVSFFRNDCGDTIELPGDLSYPDLNLGPLGDSIFWLFAIIEAKR